ncbi:dTMP kinase [Phaeobacter inhibens]|uniref:dTMP kinase n=1 Tax=Phaeobacter inhibens TaxID=221822 RepID=UPI000C9A16EC|nr:dTMP kinase [Phaeobacter inhibens]AUR07024.1 putative thymidylate kinase [Phaeobacter inhibens]AUR10800.1 putative thymidylate kinase [Phaeobacter inhibens]
MTPANTGAAADGATPYPGLFVTFEGIDGSGKSTQCRLLAESLQAQGIEVVLTREPGGSDGAEEIRRLVLEGDPDRWSAETELLLFTAARRDHMERRILPALAAGKVVVCDRFADSTRMYQGLSRGDLRASVDQLHALMIGHEPDLTILIDMDPAKGLARAKGRQGSEERFEDFGLDLQQQMRAGFLELAAEFSDRFRVIDGDRQMDSVARDVLEVVSTALPASDGGLGA